LNLSRWCATLVEVHISMEKVITTETGATSAVPGSPAPARLALVIPTLHEAANIRTVLERIGASLDLLVRHGQHGLAGAVCDGWKCSQAEVLGVIDADLQHPPELLSQLWEKMEAGHDIVIASRYAQPGSMRSWNPLRRVISELGIMLAKPLQKRGLQVKDPLSGFFLVRRRCLEGVDLQRHGFKLLLEILVRGKIGSVAEVPFTFGMRQGGESKASLATGLHYFYLLGRLWRKKRS
jgi:dolichol-phosphate mannosyltransferase